MDRTSVGEQALLLVDLAGEGGGFYDSQGQRGQSVAAPAGLLCPCGCGYDVGGCREALDSPVPDAVLAL